MSLLDAIGQDAKAAAALAEQTLAEKALQAVAAAAVGGGASLGTVQPAAAPRSAAAAKPTPVVASDLWWQDIVVLPGDPMYGPAGDVAMGPANHLAGSPAACLAELPADPQPAHPPLPCHQCGSPIFWESLAGSFHCPECQPIPSRRMAKRAWRLLWWPIGGADGEPGGQRVGKWAAFEPRYWQPFAHLEAAERAAREVEAANEAKEGRAF